MKYLKTYEGIKNLLKPKSEADIEKALLNLNTLDRLKKINDENLDDKFKPSDEEIIKALADLMDINFNKLSPLDKIDKIRRYNLNDKLKPTDEEIQKNIDNLTERIIRTTYQTITPESAENGDYADQGWENEEGENMIPDNWKYDEQTVVEKSVDFLEYNGAYTTSNSKFWIDTYYSTSSPELDYSTGEEKYYTFHLYGFTEIEQKEIFDRITRKIIIN